MNDRATIEALIADLHRQSQIYYQRLEEAELTDEEFDAKIEYLEEVAQEDEFQDLFSPGTTGFLLLEGAPGLGTEAEVEEVIAHSRPMLSLGKAKNEPELLSYLKKARASGATDFKLQAKLDGFALSALYDQGKLQKLATRGNGSEGENVRYLLDDASVTILGLPSTVADHNEFEVRGELFFTNKQFQAVDAERVALTGTHFKNSRNAVVGLMKKAKLGVDYPVEFTFSTYSTYSEGELSELTNLPEGFITVDDLTAAYLPQVKLTDFEDNDDLIESIRKFGEDRSKLTPDGDSIPTDGVVVKPTAEGQLDKAMGTTSHHPNSQVAYKYPGESVEAEVLAITVTVGKTGKLTPCARITPANVAGVVIENVTMNNYNWLYEKDVRVGSKVKVRRANDVIPEITVVLVNPQDSERVTMPEECPVCSTELSYDREDVYPPKTLKCPNDGCPSRSLFALKTAIGKNFLDIDGLADATIDFLTSTGRVNSISDLYTLTLDELSVATCGYSKDGNPRKLGEKRATNILNHIEKSKKLPLWRILSSLNIESLGFSTAKELAKRFQTIERITSLTVEEIAALDGFAYITAEKITTGLKNRAELIESLQSHGVEFTPQASPQASSTPAKTAGISFAISGAVPEPFSNRNAFVSYIEENGGTFHSSPKKETDFLVGDPQDTSSKVKKALQLGLTIISPSDFTSRFYE